MRSGLSGVRARCSRPESHKTACAVCAGQLIPHVADLTKRSELYLAGGTREDGRFLANLIAALTGYTSQCDNGRVPV